MATQKEKHEQLLDLLKRWQKLEDTAVQNTTEIIKETENPLIQVVMEIIRQDSVMHRRVQQLIIDGFTKTWDINPDELAKFWDKVEEHDELEKKVVKMAEEAKEQTNSGIVKYLLEYLLIEERKHHTLLEEMSKIKKNMYPYGGY
ncbi:MAG: hypothetical protein ACLFQX_00790 [Candidatus Kapaibacterium sp.]